MSNSRGHVPAVSALALVAALALSACGDDDDDDTAEAAVTAAELDGRVFRATDTDGHDIVDGSEITITFSGDTLAVATGCNGLTGGYTIESGRLVTGEMAATLMACEEPLMTQEAWIAEFLGSNPVIELDGNELELESGDQSMSLDEAS